VTGSSVKDTLSLVDWATSTNEPTHTTLTVSLAERPLEMAHTNGATGLGLVTNQELGADIIRLAAGHGFVPHTHPGHHILVVVGGEGTITYGGRIYATRAGQAYLVEGSVPHAVGAISDHVILAVGAPHKAVDSEARMLPVPYEEILADDGDLECLLCEVSARRSQRLHSMSCPHCPCRDCS
jgi:quercetin dioxygenase-like cupin family protein